MVIGRQIDKTNQVNLTFPVGRDILFALRKDEALFVNDIKKILALKYFQSQQLSLGLHLTHK